jgi:hypothetical protein
MTKRILTSIHGARRAGLGSLDELLINGTQVAGPTRYRANSRAVSPIWLNGAPGAALADPGYAFTMFDDFMHPVSTTVSDTQAWTVNSDGATGTPVIQDAAGGIMNIVTAAADNDYVAYSSVSEAFKFAEGKKLWLECEFKVAEATILESTWWVGLTDTLTTGGMQADAAGPLATYDGALIWKTPETAMTVNFETSNAGTQNTLSAFATSVTNVWQRAGFYFDGKATTSTIKPYFWNNTTWTAGAAQNITLSGLEEMHLVWGIKAGPTAAAETMQMDWIKAVQLR